MHTCIQSTSLAEISKRTIRDALKINHRFSVVNRIDGTILKLKINYSFNGTAQLFVRRWWVPMIARNTLFLRAYYIPTNPDLGGHLERVFEKHAEHSGRETGFFIGRHIFLSKLFKRSGYLQQKR